MVTSTGYNASDYRTIYVTLEVSIPVTAEPDSAAEAIFNVASNDEYAEYGGDDLIFSINGYDVTVPHP